MNPDQSTVESANDESDATQKAALEEISEEGLTEIAGGRAGPGTEQPVF